MPALQRGGGLAAEWRKYSDPATEFEVLRLTAPEHSCYLPAYYNACIARRGGFLIYWSDRTGSAQAFRLDLKTGESRQLTEAATLDGSSLALLAGERFICYLDDASLRQVNLTNLKDREVYRIPSGWQRTAGAGFSADGLHAVFAETKGDATRLRLLTLAKGGVTTLAEGDTRAEHPLPNPRRAQVLYRQGNEALWIVNQDGRQNRKLRLASGEIGPAMWSPDGRTVLYLRYPEDRTQLREIREFTPDLNQDRLVAKTSQFGHFGFNNNSSVFVGASVNRGSPYILILLRITRRELTVCEHGSRDVGLVAPRFAPDSQSIFFGSDRHGKPAIYRLRVERFVEKLDEEEEKS